jgi:SAM-dependent methyltransferase
MNESRRDSQAVIASRQGDGEEATGASDLSRWLNLGCGRKRLAGYLNVDVQEGVEADLVWDLDRRPWPLPSNHFELIHAGDVIEHVEDIPGFMREAHRVLALGGMLQIATPHFSCANSYRDPTHRHHLSYFSFDDFTDHGELNFQVDFRFEIVDRLIAFYPRRVNRLIAFLANKYPERYEQRFAWMFPAWFLEFRLRAVKQSAADPP